jgi:hypothetical protein
LNVSEKTPFIQFCDQGIAAGFDPPHTLKCTHNLSLIHDVTNVWLGVVENGQGLTGAVKCADIVYEIDNQSMLYHLLHNMIDTYLKHFAQDAMKSSLGVQIMCSTVAAAMDNVTASKEKYF